MSTGVLGLRPVDHTPGKMPECHCCAATRVCVYQHPVLPDGLAQARIDPETGLLNPRGGKGTIMEVFEADNLPAVQETEPGDSVDAPLEEDPYDIY